MIFKTAQGGEKYHFIGKRFIPTKMKSDLPKVTEQ